MNDWGKLVIFGGLALLLVLPPGSAWALSADELLNLMVDENIISPEKAAKIKVKARAIDKQEKDAEAAKRAQELDRVKNEAKAEAKAEAAKEVKAAAKTMQPASDWKAYWKDGLTVEKTDGNFKVKVGGKVHVDFASVSSPQQQFVDQTGATNGGKIVGNGTEFRRARLYAEGTIYKNTFYKIEYDFSSSAGTAAAKDVFLGVNGIPYIGTIRIGHQKEPFHLDYLISGSNITFMERSLVDNATNQTSRLVPERNIGIMTYNTYMNDRVYFGAGVFSAWPNDTGGVKSWNNYTKVDLTARLAGTPYYEDKGEKLVHLGIDYSHQFRNPRDPNNGVFNYSARPEAHLAGSSLYATNPLYVTGNNLINPELAVVWGPWSLQAEYTASLTAASQEFYINAANNNAFLRSSNPTFQGAYAYLSYFITGEHRPYDQKNAIFGKIIPNQNFDLKGGSGAWEVAARWSYLSLNSKNVAGGIENDITLGVNWYLNPNVRWMFNYVYGNVDKRKVPTLAGMPNTRTQGSVNVAQTRFQIDF
jgi:phosphate-selective porin OprO and OprP